MKTPPFTLAIVIASVLLTALITFVNPAYFLSQLVFLPEQIARGEIWRLITPVFLHFSFLGTVLIHLGFNAVIWYRFAGGVEHIEGSRLIVLLFLLSAIISNGCAYLSYGALFGGLSGVNYALVGYLWLRRRRLPIYHQLMPDGMFLSFMVFLALGYTGLLGNMANSAHLSGVIVGCGFALLINQLKRRSSC